MAHVTSTSPLTIEDLATRITLSVDEVAGLLGLGRTATYEAVRRGEIPTRRLGRRIVVPVPALQMWLGVYENVGDH